VSERYERASYAARVFAVTAGSLSTGVDRSADDSRVH